MIAWLKGTVKEKIGDRVIIDQGGVGYEVLLPSRLAKDSMVSGTICEFYIYTYVREDVLSLFGFGSWKERELFLELIKVSGIGAKTAMGILSQFEPATLVQAITTRNTQAISSVKGIGKKAAEKIVIELSDRLKTFGILSLGSEVTISSTSSPHSDLVSALTNLGYKRPAIDMALSKLPATDLGFDQMFKESLKILGPS